METPAVWLSDWPLAEGGRRMNMNGTFCVSHLKNGRSRLVGSRGLNDDLSFDVQRTQRLLNRLSNYRLILPWQTSSWGMWKRWNYWTNPHLIKKNPHGERQMFLQKLLLYFQLTCNMKGWKKTQVDLMWYKSRLWGRQKRAAHLLGHISPFHSEKVCSRGRITRLLRRI